MKDGDLSIQYPEWNQSINQSISMEGEREGRTECGNRTEQRGVVWGWLSIELSIELDTLAIASLSAI
jgi:hypothetical protein